MADELNGPPRGTPNIQELRDILFSLGIITSPPARVFESILHVNNDKGCGIIKTHVHCFLEFKSISPTAIPKNICSFGGTVKYYSLFGL
jgi:hypothetical protein